MSDDRLILLTGTIGSPDCVGHGKGIRLHGFAHSGVTRKPHRARGSASASLAPEQGDDMYETSDIRKGLKIQLDGYPYVVVVRAEPRAGQVGELLDKLLPESSG